MKRRTHDFCPNCNSWHTELLELCLVEPYRCTACGATWMAEVVSDATLCDGLPEYNGWRAYYEYPGFISYVRDGQDVGLVVTSDWDGAEEELLVSVVDDQGERIPSGMGVSHEGYYQWPSVGRTSEAMFELLKPHLDECTGLRRRHPCTRCGATLTDEMENVCSNPGEGCCPASPELTAETITDAQIQEMRERAHARVKEVRRLIAVYRSELAKMEAEEQELDRAMIATGVALGMNDIMTEQKDYARARCVELLTEKAK